MNLPSFFLSLFRSPPPKSLVFFSFSCFVPPHSLDCSRPFDALTNDAVVVTVLEGDGVGVLLCDVDRVGLSVYGSCTTHAKLATMQQIHFGTRPLLSIEAFVANFFLEYESVKAAAVEIFTPPRARG